MVGLGGARLRISKERMVYRLRPTRATFEPQNIKHLSYAW
jgi:hypothetical protein